MLVASIATRGRGRLIAPPALVNATMFGASAIANDGGLSLLPALFADPDTFGTPVVAHRDGQGLAPQAIVDPDSFGAHVIVGTGAALLMPSQFADADSFGVPAIAGAPANPWDTDASLPASASSSGSANATLSGIGTANADDLLLAFFGSAAGGSVTVPSGYTQQINALNAGGTNFSRLAVASKQVTATQSGVFQAWSNPSMTWGLVGDALAGSGAAPVVEATNSNGFSGTSSGTVTIASVAAGEIIVVAVHCEKNATTQSVSSVTDDQGHDYARRKQLQWTGGGSSAGNNLEIWWARAPGNVAGNTTITVTLSAATDDAEIGVLRVGGCIS